LINTGGEKLEFGSLPLSLYKGFILEILPTFTWGFMLESFDVLFIKGWFIEDNLELLINIGLILDRLA
jgi:hypothetical protein